MIISHKHKFIFLKTKKTAGTSLEIALSKVCGPEDIITPITENDEVARKEYSGISAQNYRVPLGKYNKLDWLEFVLKFQPVEFYNHITAEKVKRLIPKSVWDNYYKFTIERNPFDKIVSFYYWSQGHKKFNSVYDFLINGGLKKFISYDLYSINGLVAVNKIYKYEDMNFILKDLKDKLEIAEPLQMPKHKAKSTRREVENYKDVLDEKSIDLIKVIFAREIELLNYQY